ncbi:serine/arginine repetitive matrix protein 2 isoform X2 [Latimeria chalumnae]|uniref:serine/arginine repetitive matrix protein 2 isoform X2 n=1 Tax=Latimeria chalumnae TaxID=7897 RepID=UPI00313D2FC6
MLVNCAAQGSRGPTPGRTKTNKGKNLPILKEERSAFSTVEESTGLQQNTPLHLTEDGEQGNQAKRRRKMRTCQLKESVFGYSESKASSKDSETTSSMTLPTGVSTFLLDCLAVESQAEMTRSDSSPDSLLSPEVFREAENSDGADIRLPNKDSVGGWQQYKNSTLQDTSMAVNIDMMPQLSSISDISACPNEETSNSRTSLKNSASSCVKRRVSAVIAGKAVCRLLAKEKTPKALLANEAPVQRMPEKKRAKTSQDPMVSAIKCRKKVNFSHPLETEITSHSQCTPRKSPSISSNSASTRSPGRPKKSPSISSNLASTGSPERQRKLPRISSNSASKGSPGRPEKSLRISSNSASKKSSGRPRKSSSISSNSASTGSPGRPKRSLDISSYSASKRSPERPKKSPSISSNLVSTGSPERPRKLPGISSHSASQGSPGRAEPSSIYPNSASKRENGLSEAKRRSLMPKGPEENEKDCSEDWSLVSGKQLRSSTRVRNKSCCLKEYKPNSIGKKNICRRKALLTSTPSHTPVGSTLDLSPVCRATEDVELAPNPSDVYVNSKEIVPASLSLEERTKHLPSQMQNPLPEICCIVGSGRPFKAPLNCHWYKIPNCNIQQVRPPDVPIDIIVDPKIWDNAPRGSHLLCKGKKLN